MKNEQLRNLSSRLGAIIDELLSEYILWIVEPEHMEYEITYEDKIALQSFQDVLIATDRPNSSMLPHLEIDFSDSENPRFFIYNKDKDKGIMKDYSFLGDKQWLVSLHKNITYLSGYNWGEGESIDIFEEKCYDMAFNMLKNSTLLNQIAWNNYLQYLYTNITNLSMTLNKNSNENKLMYTKNLINKLIFCFECFEEFKEVKLWRKRK